MENIYIGIPKLVYSDFQKVSPISIHQENIEDFFIITKGSYTFNEENEIFINNNSSVQGSTATLTLQAKYDMDISFDYFYSTSQSSNIFKIQIGNIYVEWSYPSLKVFKSYSTKIKKDTLISFSYYKSSYAENYESKCGFQNMIIKPSLPHKIEEIGVSRQVKKFFIGLDNVARQIVRAYIGVDGYARPCYGVYGLTKNGQISMGILSDRGACTTVYKNNAIISSGTESYNMVSCSKTLTFSKLSYSYSYWNPGSASIGIYGLMGGGATAAYSGAISSMYYYSTSLTRSSATNLTVARQEIKTMSLQNKYAFFCGGRDTNNSFTKNIDIYNTSFTKTAKTLSSSLGWHAVASTKNHGIIINSDGNKYCFDTSFTMTLLPPEEKYQYDRTGASIGNYALFAGGGTSTTTDTSTKDILIFDSSLSKINSTISLSQKNMKLQGVSTDKHAVFGAGHYYSSIVDAYDQYLTHLPQTNTSSGRQYASGGYVGNYILFCGGLSSDSTADTYVVI